MMKTEPTSLPDILVIDPARLGDDRGWFSETWNAARMSAAGLDLHFVQDNHSYSAAQYTMRGLHFQKPPHAQDKLVRCSRGAIYDVAVDIRRGSPYYGRWTGIELSVKNGRQLLIPSGFLHAFLTLTPDCEVQYKCTDFYAPDCDGAVRWDDPDIGIDWPLPPGVKPVLSAKDSLATGLSSLESPFTWESAE